MGVVVRVLALTESTSLVVALTFMGGDWEVVAVTGIDQAVDLAPEASVALIDLGTTELGLRAAAAFRRRGVTLPCLVAGDREPAGVAIAPLLLRPFTVEQVRARLIELTGGSAPSGPAARAPSPKVTRGRAMRSVDKPVLGPATRISREPEVLPQRVPLTSLPEAPPSPPAPPTATVLQARPATPPPATPPAARPAVVAPPSVASPPPREREKPAPVVSTPGPLASGPAATAAPPVLRRGGGAGRAKERAGKRQRSSGLRLRGRRRPELAEVEDLLVARIARAAEGVCDLECLLAEMPALGNPQALAEGFLAGVDEELGPEVCAVWSREADGRYRMLAGRGLSETECALAVPGDQPLFVELARNMGSVLVAPVDMAQGLVVGIGGARTEALMAAALGVGEICCGIATAGSSDFSEADLDRFAALAAEAGPGLAVAQALQRIRGSRKP